MAYGERGWRNWRCSCGRKFGGQTALRAHIALAVLEGGRVGERCLVAHYDPQDSEDVRVVRAMTGSNNISGVEKESKPKRVRSGWG